MKPNLFRILVGVIAFFVGIISAFIVPIKTVDNDLPCQFRNKQVETSQNVSPTIPQEKIEIRFIGFGKIEKRPTLRFKGINNTAFPVKRRAIVENGEIPVKFNGNELNGVWTGLCIYPQETVLNPKESFDIEVLADIRLFKVINQEGDFEFGCDFYMGESSLKIRIWSEPITISKKMRKEIIKNAPDFSKEKKYPKLPNEVPDFIDKKLKL